MPECVDSLSQEDIDTIQSSAFLLSLCYDLNLLPEQLLALKNTPSYPVMRAMLNGLLACYRAIMEKEKIKELREQFLKAVLTVMIHSPSPSPSAREEIAYRSLMELIKDKSEESE